MSTRTFALTTLLSLTCACLIAPPPCRAGDPASQPASQPAGRGQAALDRVLPAVNFSAVPVEDVFNFLGDITGARFDVDWPALKKAGVARDSTIVLKVANQKLSQVLDEIARQLVGTEPLGYKARGDAIRISTKSALKSEKQ